ncbi:MAG: hypothetical protein IPJ88_13340 [Myxococcales bacterium]|nr:MAG: hypothetical protein IPJ88_13340 [Myxococcales bacterium]
MTLGWSTRNAGIHSYRVAFIALSISFGLSCGGEDTVDRQGLGGGADEGKSSDLDGENAGKQKAVIEFSDDMFVETEENRDPFRTFFDIFQTKVMDQPQREVMMSNVSLDQMRLTAIISGVPSPRALIVAPTGVGYIVQRGDFLGRPEVLQVDSDSPPLVLNWRVSRVRGADPKTGQVGQVVLTRENPMAPNQPPLSRILALASDEND